MGLRLLRPPDELEEVAQRVPQLPEATSPQQLRDLVLRCLGVGGNGPFELPPSGGEPDDAGSAVARVGLAHQVAAAHEVAEELGAALDAELRPEELR